MYSDAGIGIDFDSCPIKYSYTAVGIDFFKPISVDDYLENISDFLESRVSILVPFSAAIMDD